jgi:hypothetical protein
VLTAFRGVLCTLMTLLVIAATGAIASANPVNPVVVTSGNSGSVRIGVETAGGASTTGSTSGSSHSTDATNPCLADPGGTACISVERDQFCSAMAADWAGGSRLGGPVGRLTDLSAAQLVDVNAVLAKDGCPPLTAATSAPSAAELAQRAYGLLRLPAPAPGRYPAGVLTDGRPYTVVNTLMWFWTDRAAWRPVSKRVCAGALCGTATARPTGLSLDPGDGGPAVSCPGPGTAWVRPAGGSWVPGAQPQGCAYRYVRSSFGYPGGQVSASYAITWDVAWSGTDGTRGVLDPLSTTSAARFAVAELQAVVVQ